MAGGKASFLPTEFTLGGELDKLSGVFYVFMAGSLGKNEDGNKFNSLSPVTLL